jgi:hypothetical protein
LSSAEPSGKWGSVTVDSQTIRDYIKRRVRLAFAAAFAAWLSIPLFVFANKGKEPIPVVLVAVAIPVFFGVILYMTWFLRCPRCRANLGQTVAVPIAFRWGRRKMNFCPYCGVSLDEPVSHGPTIGG